MKPLTWNELADLYGMMTGKVARSLPMKEIFDWAAAQKDKFSVDQHGCIYLVKK